MLLAEAFDESHRYQFLRKEYERAWTNLQRDPPQAVTAACALLESLCKIYIYEHKLEMPKETVKPLWTVVQKHLNLDPSTAEDQDIRKILAGLSSIVDGV